MLCAMHMIQNYCRTPRPCPLILSHTHFPKTESLTVSPEHSAFHIPKDVKASFPIPCQPNRSPRQANKISKLNGIGTKTVVCGAFKGYQISACMPCSPITEAVCSNAILLNYIFCYEQTSTRDMERSRISFLKFTRTTVTRKGICK